MMEKEGLKTLSKHLSRIIKAMCFSMTAMLRVVLLNRCEYARQARHTLNWTRTVFLLEINTMLSFFSAVCGSPLLLLQLLIPLDSALVGPLDIITTLLTQPDLHPMTLNASKYTFKRFSFSIGKGKLSCVGNGPLTM